MPSFASTTHVGLIQVLGAARAVLGCKAVVRLRLAVSIRAHRFASTCPREVQALGLQIPVEGLARSVLAMGSQSPAVRPGALACPTNRPRLQPVVFTGMFAPNNSFKPKPLRSTTTSMWVQGRFRLNSGVRWHMRIRRLP